MKTRLLIFLAGSLGAWSVLGQSSREGMRVIPAQILATNSLKQLLAGPDKVEEFSAWLEGMRTYRAQVQGLLKQTRAGFADPYSAPELQWAQRSYIQALVMAHDRYLYDPASGHYTVERYLQDLNRRYGGIDSVLIWPTYPNIGVDNRNQFDLWHDLPGGLPGLRHLVSLFHQHGVRVLIPIMIWDEGTRDPGSPMTRLLVQLSQQIGADGLNGDTMSPVGLEFYSESLKLGAPQALEPELGVGDQIEALAWNVLSWGYWWPYQSAPGIDRYKWIEPRHLSHVCDRWAHDRTEMLQQAFFNGDGYVSWENIWGIWNEVNPHDAEVLRRMSEIYRALPDLLVSVAYEPFTPTLQSGVYATRFPGKSACLWTFVNRTDSAVSGPQIRVGWEPGSRFFDLWHGSELESKEAGTAVTLSFQLEPRGFGAVLSTGPSPEKRIRQLLSKMRNSAQSRFAELPSRWQELPQRLVDIPKTKPASEAPPGMVRIPGGTFLFRTEGVMIEQSEGVDVQFPWEDKPTLKHSHELSLPSFFIDRTPVTCAEFKRFVDATGYQPRDPHNFLRPWTKGSFPAGWAQKPVTWVSLEDARAYASWAGKRLPHEWEWQYAAQGTDGRLFPWGNQKDDRRLPPLDESREQAPPADVEDHPDGASPFGVVDLLGNVWQWTDEFQDTHTRAAILKGGSGYRPQKSMWYFPQARQLNQHGKYLLMAPSLDRSGSIGFRCVVDAQ